jgi:NAD(P)-dependent dehydrogenase (short-subunit alcohol dehydrogenase family)
MYRKEIYMQTQTEQNRTLSGKRVVILGGTSGIGFATAALAAREGAAVVVASSRQERVDRALSRLPKGAEGHVLDLSDEEQVRNFFARIGAFDHLVFTAGEKLLIGELGATDVEQARHFFDLRFWGAFMAAKHGSGNIRPGGSIVLTSGLAGQRPNKGWTIVASICSAAEGLTRALAVELAPIRVNLVCPGLVKTELWDNMSEQDRNTRYQAAGQNLPVGQVGEAQDLAETYLYLMRERFSTGQVVIVDGGASLV